MDHTARRELIEQLRERTRQMESACRGTGSPADQFADNLSLPELLTGRRLPPGWLIEWRSSGEGSGAETLALAVAGSAISPRGRLVVIDPTGEFYAPGAASWGVALDRVIVLRPKDPRAAWWCWEQVLRGESRVVVWGHVPPGGEQEWMRLRWAARRSGNSGFLLPMLPAAAPIKPDLRLLVRPLPTHRSSKSPQRRWRIEVLSASGSIHGKAADVVLSHETNLVRLVAELAHPTASVSPVHAGTG